VILADTSIWIEMFRKGRFKQELANLVTTDQLCIHPFVIGELACGNLPDRQKTLTYLDQLKALPVIGVGDVRVMVEARGLWSKGIGLTDAQLLASCLATPGTRIWTSDTPLARVAQTLGIGAKVG
jgi:predicted nucleic acid-binding protein